MSVSRYLQWMCEQRIKVIVSEAARKNNREALLDVVLKQEDGYYSLPYKLVGTEFYDIKTALLYSVELNKLKNVKTICEFLKRHENLQGLDLDCVIRAIKYRNYEAAKLIVSVYQEKLKDKEMMEKDHHPRPAVLDLDTIIFAMKNWEAELAQFVISIFLQQNDTYQKNDKMKFILSNLHTSSDQFDKDINCLFPILTLDTVIFAMKNWGAELARFAISAFLHQNNEDINQDHEKHQEIQQRKTMFFDVYRKNNPLEPDIKSLFSFLNLDTIKFAMKNWDAELTQFIVSVYSNNNPIKFGDKNLNTKLKTFFFQEKYDECKPVPIPAPALRRIEESVEERKIIYIR